MGDLLLFVRDGRLCTHRLVDRLDHAGAARLITCGDAATQCDPPVAPSEILGTVASITRGWTRNADCFVAPLRGFYRLQSVTQIFFGVRR